MLIDRSKEILFGVTEDALLIANGGRAFSRTGVLSVCASHLSDKLSDPPRDLNCDNCELVQAIRDKELRTYKNDSDRIKSDFRGVEETKKDYDDRFVWELLQNADDAMREESGDFIGSKGLGFKSVLEITDEPEIHSDPFHFRFSAKETQALLREKDLDDDPPPLTFRIPHEREPDEETNRLLESGYTTVIRLPFQDEEARDKAVDQLHGLDPLFLLLVHELSCIRIRVPEGETVHEIVRCASGLSTGDVELSSRGSSTSWRRWVRSQLLPRDDGKRLTAAICLPMSSGGVIPHDAKIPFHVFFPTEEKIGARALVHASLDLKQDRDRIRGSDNDDAILQTFNELFQDMLEEVPARTALEAFGDIASEDEDSPLGRLQKGIRETLCETPFVPVIGGEQVRPAEVRLWSDRLGFVLRDDAQEVRDARLLVPELRELSGVLKSFEARYIEAKDYIRLLCYCRNDSLKESLASLCALVKQLCDSPYGADREDLKNIPCWWTETEGARALDDETPLLRARPKDWPEWLPADWLHPMMQKAWQRWEEKLSGKCQFLSGQLLRSKEQFLHDVLLPFIAKWDDECWEADGWRALRQVLSWSSIREFGEALPWVESVDESQAKKQRAQAAKVLHLLTNKGWLPAADCYAGEVWDGPPAFDRFFADIEGRGLVLPFFEWPDSVREGADKDRWKPLLRWAGVSWEPKVRRIENPPKNHELVGSYIETNSLPTLPHLYKTDNRKVEYFPECMEDDDAKLADVIKKMLPLAVAVRDPWVEYRPSNRHSSTRRCDENFAYFQLRRSEWLPCKPALLHDGKRAAPREAFLPGKGLGGLLPEVDRGGIENEEWYQRIQGGLTGMGVQEELPTDPMGLHEWMRKLSDLSSDNDTKEDLRKAAESLYREYLKLDGDNNKFPPDIPVPCLSWENEKEVLTFSSPGKVFHVDQPHLDEVKRKIMQKGYKLFILSLGSGSNAPERLGVRLLSGTLQAEPRYESSEEGASEKLLERYGERRRGLELAANLNQPLPEDLNLIAVRGLKLKLEDSGKHLADVEVLSWKESQDGPLLINLDKGEWRALGHGLAERIARKADKASLFEILLGEDDKGFFDRLRYEGVTEADIENLELERLYRPGDGQEGGTEEGHESQPQEGDGPASEPTTPVDQSPKDIDDFRPSGQDNGSQTDRDIDGTYRRSKGAAGDDGPSDPRAEGGTQGPPRPESGDAAEVWFEQQLKNSFPGYVKDHVRDAKSRESDFVVTHLDTEFHIEVKHVEKPPGTIYWSGLECEKAQDFQERYFMAVLFPDGEQRHGEKRYEIHWIWRPLDELKMASRSIQWEGNSGYKPVDADSWDVAAQKPDKVPVKRYDFRIKLNDEILESFEKDDGSLDKLREKTNGKDKWCPRPDSNRHGVAPTSPSS